MKAVNRPHWTEIVSPKFLVAGLILLLAGGAVTVYNFTRPLPVSVEQVAPISLSEKKPQETPTPADEVHEAPPLRAENVAGDKTGPRRSSLADTGAPEPEAIDPLNVEITSPASFLSLVRKEKFTIEAVVSPGVGKVEKVEFFYLQMEEFSYSERLDFFKATPETESGSIYNSQRDVEIAGASLVRIIEVERMPYVAADVSLEPGSYSLYAMVTDEFGVRRISSPRFVTVKAYIPGSNPRIAGWRRPRFTELMVWAVPAGPAADSESPTSLPMPLAGECSGTLDVIPLIEKDDQRRGILIKEGLNVRFRDTEPHSGEPQSYNWHLSAGRIVKGADSGEIVVDTSGLGGQIVRAAIEKKDRDGNIYKACGSVGILQETPNNRAGYRAAGRSYPSCPAVSEKLMFGVSLMAGSHEINVCPFNSGDPRNNADGIKKDPGGEKGKLLKKDPGNKADLLRVDLTALVGGVYGNKLRFKYHTDGGAVIGSGKEAVWDLTSVRSVPGEYTAVVEVDDGCQSKVAASATVRISNYCTPCFGGKSESNLKTALEYKVLSATVTAPDGGSGPDGLNYEWSISRGVVPDGQKGNVILFAPALDQWAPVAENFIETSVKIRGLKPQKGTLSLTYDIATDPNEPKRSKKSSKPNTGGMRKPLDRSLMWYEWTLSDSTGLLDSGRRMGEATPDISKVRENDPIILKVKAGGFDRFKFIADVPQWALIGKDVEYKWSSAQGTVVSGQGSPVFEIKADGTLPCGSIGANVKIGGLKLYCINSLDIPAYKDSAESTSGISKAFPKFVEGLSRPAGRRDSGNQGNPETLASRETRTSGGDTLPPDPGNPVVPAKNVEREYIKVAWPDKPVQVQRSFNVIVTYNRTLDTMEIIDTTGKVTADMTGEMKLIKERWGPDYDVYGYVSLQSDSLYRDGASCGTECKSKILRMTNPVSEWTFSVTPNIAGEHKFNLEFWIEGVNRSTGAKMEAEKVWGMNNLAVDVRDDLPTRFHLILSSGFLGVFGLFFVARSIKLGGIKLMIAGGDIVGGDKVGGDKVGGDKIGGDKIGGDKTENIDSG